MPALISVHSFSPVLGGVARPWDVAVLWDEDTRLAAPALVALRRDPALAVGANEPYSGRLPDRLFDPLQRGAQRAAARHLRAPPGPDRNA